MFGAEYKLFCITKVNVVNDFLCIDHLFVSTPLEAQLIVTIAYVMVKMCLFTLS